MPMKRDCHHQMPGIFNVVIGTLIFMMPGLLVVVFPRSARRLNQTRFYTIIKEQNFLP